MTRLPRLLLLWSAAPAVLLGFWLLRVADAPRSVQLQQVVVTTVAAATFVVVVRGRGWRSTGDSQWPPLALAASLFIPMLAGASAGPLAVAVYYATLFALAPLQTTPVPLLGFGAGPILGYLLVASVVSRSFVSQAAAHSMAAQAERVH